MAEKILKTRIQLKYDTWEHWNSTAGKAVVLKKGEIGICEIPAKTGEVASEPAIIFKVGDGTTIFSSLPWASAKAADVYKWAKCSNVELDGNVLKFHNNDKDNPEHSIDLSSLVPSLTADKSILIDTKDPKNPKISVNFANANENDNVIFTVDNGGIHGKVDKVETANKVANTLTLQVAGSTKAAFDGSQATTVDITAADLGLSGAMHFLGITTTEIMDGSTEWPLIGTERREPHIGDVVIYNNKEFVWCLQGDAGGEMDAWEELGDGSSYALKTYTVTAGEGLEGGNQLQYNPTLKIKDGGVTTDKIADANVTGAKIAANAIDTTHLSTNLADWIKNQISSETASLAAIAKTGNVFDLVQDTGDVLVFDCGSATELVENTTTEYRITIINPSILAQQYSATVTELGTWADLIASNVEFTSKFGSITLKEESGTGKVQTSDNRYICAPNQTDVSLGDKYILTLDDVDANSIYEIEIMGS